MKIKYAWKVLTENGLLVEPPETSLGITVNGYKGGSFETEAAAIAMFQLFEEDHEYTFNGIDFVLIKMVCKGEPE